MTDRSSARPQLLFGSFSAVGLALILAGCSTTKKPAELVDVQKAIPGIVLDIRYATTNNFTGQQLYPFSKCYLRRAAATKLRAAQAELAAMGYGLKIFDGYRPLSVQWKMWEIYPHPGYVADPRKGSRHNRGAAVDVTLIRLADGAELLMPTPYDDFTEKAHRDFMDLPAEAIRNRELLEQVLTKHGFVGLKTEWWHFDDKDWRKYSILNLDVSETKSSSP
jgi:D-alanyl-D-alanine dipeptidase